MRYTVTARIYDEFAAPRWVARWRVPRALWKVFQAIGVPFAYLGVIAAPTPCSALISLLTNAGVLLASRTSPETAGIIGVLAAFLVLGMSFVFSGYWLFAWMRRARVINVDAGCLLLGSLLAMSVLGMSASGWLD